MKKTIITNGLMSLLLLASFGACKDSELPKNEKELQELVEKSKEEQKKKEEGEKTEEEQSKEKKEGKEDKDKKEDEQSKEEKGKDEEKPSENKKEKEEEEKKEDKPIVEPTAKFAEPATLSPIFYVKFTGQDCLYCPEDTRITEASQKRYGKENYIYAALHSEEKFSVFQKQVSLYSKEAELYRRNITNEKGLPDGYYGRLGRAFSPLSDLSPKEMLKEADLLECKGSAKILSEGELSVKLTPLLRRDRQDFVKGKKLNMLIWILENDIVAYQVDAGDKRYYTWPKHKHIFRSSLNGHWGEPLKFGQTYEKTFKVPKNVAKLQNCEIIVLFLEDDSKVVHDAAYFEVK